MSYLSTPPGGGGGGGSPGGSSTQVQYNNAGSFGGITGATTNGTTLTLVAPILGTPASGTLTNCTGLPISTGVSGLGTGVATALAVNTGSAGAVVLFNGALGTPTSGVATNLTGLPISTGVSGLGTGVATALAVNVGSAGAFVTFNGALGTPSSGTGTNITGVPISTGISGLATGIATFLATPTSANLLAAVTDETGTGALVFATSPTLVTPVLGTPTSGTLTNCTGLPISGLVASTSTAIGVGSVELGNASDTTLSRSAAGVLAVEGVVIPSISSTNTITNKRVQPRVVATTQSATPTINTDNGDIFEIVGLAQAITSMTTNLSGTPVEGEMIEIIFKDNATARAITWGASFVSSTATLPTTTVISTPLAVLLQYRTSAVWTASSAWYCIAVA